MDHLCSVVMVQIHRMYQIPFTNVNSVLFSEQEVHYFSGYFVHILKQCCHITM